MATVVKMKQVRNAHRTNIKRLEGNINDAVSTRSDDKVTLKGFHISLMNKTRKFSKTPTTPKKLLKKSMMRLFMANTCTE